MGIIFSVLIKKNTLQMIVRTIIIKSLSDAPPSGSYERTTLLTLLPVFYFSQPGAGFFFSSVCSIVLFFLIQIIWILRLNSSAFLLSLIA